VIDSGELAPKDIKGLPEDVVKELGFDPLEFAILELIDNAGGRLSLDRIITDYFRRHSLLLKRKDLSSKLWRMRRKGAIDLVEGRKAIYTTNLEQASVGGDS